MSSSVGLGWWFRVFPVYSLISLCVSDGWVGEWALKRGEVGGYVSWQNHGGQQNPGRMKGTLMRYLEITSQLWAVKNVSIFFRSNFFSSCLTTAVVGMLLELCANLLCYLIDPGGFWEMSTWYIVSFYLAVYILFTSRYYLFEKCTTKAVRSEDPIPVTLTAFREIRKLLLQSGTTGHGWVKGWESLDLDLKKHLIAIGDFLLPGILANPTETRGGCLKCCEVPKSHL